MIVDTRKVSGLDKCLWSPIGQLFQIIATRSLFGEVNSTPSSTKYLAPVISFLFQPYMYAACLSKLLLYSRQNYNSIACMTEANVSAVWLM